MRQHRVRLAAATISLSTANQLDFTCLLISAARKHPLFASRRLQSGGAANSNSKLTSGMNDAKQLQRPTRHREFAKATFYGIALFITIIAWADHAALGVHAGWRAVDVASCASNAVLGIISLLGACRPWIGSNKGLIWYG
jgi:hypothetical protein